MEAQKMIVVEPVEFSINTLFIWVSNILSPAQPDPLHISDVIPGPTRPSPCELGICATTTTGRI